MSHARYIKTNTVAIENLGLVMNDFKSYILLSSFGLLAAMACNGSSTAPSPSIEEALTLFDDMDDWAGFEGEAHSAEGSLSSLKTLERDFAFVHHYYVDSDKLVGERLREMLEMSLQNVESQVDEVQFIVNDTEVIANVGTRSRTIAIQSLKDLSDMLRILQPVAAFLDGALSESVERPMVEYMLLNGALSVLDPHSILLPPVAAAEMALDNQGEFGGLGIEISIQEGQLTVKQPIEGTPAWDEGLKAEDKIVRIENTSTVNMDLDEAVSLLRGKVGEPVTILVKRTGWATPKPFTIVRGRIKIDPVKGEILEDDVAYLKIQSFHQNVAEDMNALLKKMTKQSSKGLNGLVLDLRNNPGGYLSQAIKVSDRFLRNGVIVATVEGAERTREENHARSSNTLTDIPIVVLVNGNSASASEIVAGALRNQSRAIIVGERTFGKGSVQHLYGNPDESRLKLTVAQYLTPGDQSIQSVGIPPDILLQPTLIRPETEDDQEMVSLYWREWLTREGDLDRHLDNESTLEGQTRFSVRYLYEEKEGKDRTDPKKDWEVGFARELLLKTEGVDRASAMIAAKSLVETVQAAEAVKMEQQFESVEIDWRAGPNFYDNASSDLIVKFVMDEDGVLNAGEEEQIKVQIENTSGRPYHQISLLLLSEHPSIDHREMYFGYIAANTTVENTSMINIPHGYGTETVEMTIELRDPTQTLFEQQQTISTLGTDLPVFSWDLSLYDGIDGKGKGNGNRIPEVGEQVVLSVDITNVGNGRAIEPYVRLKNRSRKSLDLLEGTVELGAQKSDCDVEECSRELLSGMTETGELIFDVKAVPDDEVWNLEVLVGANRSYDYSTAVRGGFPEYFQLKTDVEIPVGKVFETRTYNQPKITIDVQSQQGDFLELSGFVDDESGITDILVFSGEDKVYYKGETGLSGRVPFGIDIELVEGSNPVYILAKDNQGLQTSKFVQIWK